MSLFVLMFVIFNITLSCTVRLENYDIVNRNRLRRGVIKPENVQGIKDQGMVEQKDAEGNDKSVHEAAPKVFNIDNNSTLTTQNTSSPSKPFEVTKINKTDTNTFIFPKSAPDYNTVLRGFYVFLGLSAFVLLYVAFRSYRLRRGGNRPTTVRKYGVLTQRTDIEMSPLQLDEDDEDDTVFEVGSHINR